VSAFCSHQAASTPFHRFARQSQYFSSHAQSRRARGKKWMGSAAAITEIMRDGQRRDIMRICARTPQCWRSRVKRCADIDRQRTALSCISSDACTIGERLRQNDDGNIHAA
jgi:hypothetical protein